MSNNLNIAESTNYEQKATFPPKYKPQRLFQNSSGTTVSINTNGPASAIFDIPAGVVFNLAKSYLRGQLDVFGNAAGATCQSLFTDIPPITRALLESRNSVPLADIQYFQDVWKMTSNLITPTEVFNSYPSVGVGVTEPFSQVNGVCLFNNPSNSGIGTAPNDSAAAGPPGLFATKIAVPAGAGGIPIVDDVSIGRKNYQSQQQYVTTGAGNAADTTQNNSLYWQLNFDKIPFSIFSLNRDMYTTESLRLTFDFAPVSAIGFNHAAVATLVGGTNLDQTVPATMTNVNLYLAIEQNPVIVEEVKNKVLSSGLSFTYPYPIILKQGLGATQNASATFKFTKSYGQRLLRVITAESLTSNSNVTRCCFYNWANPLPYITGTYRTTLNSTQLQDETIDESKGDGYRYNAQKLKGCPLENLVEYYTQCPCNIDDWSAADKMIDCPEADLQMCGISLENEQIYGKIITKNPYNGNTYYDTTMTAIGVVQRTLTLGPYGVTVRT